MGTALHMSIFQLLYQKAAEIVQASPEVKNVIVILGEFRLMMFYMGAMEHIMGESGMSVQ